MSLRISQLKKRVGGAVKFSTSVGVAATVAASTLIASAVETIDVTTASGLVETHAKRTNTEANLAAKILDIDRSSLVNKNYLRLASTIDDYLTGKTDKLVVDSSMFGTSVAVEQVMPQDDVTRALSSVKQTIESEPSDVIANTETHEVVDETSNVSDFAKEISSLAAQSQVAGVSSVQITALPTIAIDENKNDLVTDRSEASEDTGLQRVETDHSSEDLAREPEDLKPDILTEDIKMADQIESVRPSVVETIDRSSRVESLKTASEIVDKKSASQDAINALMDAVHSKDSVKSEEPTQIFDTIETDNDSSSIETSENETSENHEDVEETIAPISDLPESERTNVDSETISESDTSESKESIASNDDSEEIFGTFTIHIVRRYNNNRYIDEFDIVKQSKGIRHADGSEEWESIKFNASDLLESQKITHSNGNDYSLMYPDFEVFYTPKSADDRIDDRLTLSKVEKSEEVKEIESSDDLNTVTDDTSSEEILIQEDEDKSESSESELETVETDDTVEVDNDQSVSADDLAESDSLQEVDQILSRKIVLKKEDGSIIQEIHQSSKDEEVQISQIVGDLFTDLNDLSIRFDSEDLEVVYRPIYSDVFKIENYLVKNVNESGEEISSYFVPVRITGITNNLDKTSRFDTDSLESSSAVNHSTLEDYEFSDTTFNHIDKIVTHRYISKAKEVEEKRDAVTVSKEDVRSVALSMLESMPTLSNRVEYSKFTTIEESYSRILQKDAIESLVFDVSNGVYDYLASDKVLQSSQESVLVSEINSRFTDRLVYRVNEFRRALRLQEVSKVSMSQEMDRMFASATIYNYLNNNHSNSKVGRNFEKIVGLERIETMQPVHTLSTSKIGMTPEAAADSLFRTILSEANSYASNDGGETGHLEQLIDADQRQIYAGMFVGGYDVSDQYVNLFGKKVKSGTKYSYSISTTLHYFK